MKTKLVIVLFFLCFIASGFVRECKVFYVCDNTAYLYQFLHLSISIYIYSIAVAILVHGQIELYQECQKNVCL